MYTILIHPGGPSLLRVKRALERKINESARGRFKAEFSVHQEKNEIWVKPVRLRESKSYCGQHPGECFIGGPRRKGRWLEWNDWIEFHGVVNDVLDRLQVSADIWTVPPEKMDRGSKMWVRRGIRRRIQYEWKDAPNLGGGRPIRIWNHGSEDQFSIPISGSVHDQAHSANAPLEGLPDHHGCWARRTAPGSLLLPRDGHCHRPAHEGQAHQDP